MENNRERLKKELLQEGYSENSASYISNTYFLKGAEKHWEKKTKNICKRFDFIKGV